MSAGTTALPATPHGSPTPPATEKAVSSLRQERGRVDVRLPNLDALFDRASPPAYPHTGPMVERSVAKFLVDATREQPRRPEVEVVLDLEGPPVSTATEDDTRRHVHRFFGNEAELAALDLRVNRAEGIGALQYSIPFVLVALLAAGVLYVHVGEASGTGFVETLVYLVFITIVWVMLWDPVELLLFDGYLIRRRLHALQKLSRARLTFAYHPSTGP